MQIIFILLCSFFVIWAYEIRHRDTAIKVSETAEDMERIKDELANITKQLKVVLQKLNDIGISTS